jgi:hypothetical protein
MLVSVFAAILSHDASWFSSFASKASAMMALDHPVVPAVVLVVEDEMLLRMRAVDMVEDAGYTPVEAVDADEAAHTVHERWPPIKIIVVSGQLKPATVDIPADCRFHGKPLEAREMIAEIQSMIGDV